MFILIPLLNIIGLQIVYLVYPKLIYFVGPLIIAATLFFIIRVTRQNSQFRDAVMISATLFLLVHYLLVVFLEGGLLVQGFIFLTNFVLFVLLYSLHDKYREGQSQLKYGLQNIIGYSNLMVFYFLAVDIFYLDLYSNQKFLIFVALFGLGVFLLSYSSLKVFDVISRKAFMYIGIVLLCLIEVFWIVNLLPISVYSQGALVSIVYYVVLGLSRHYLIFGWEELKRKVVGRYILISVIGVFLVLLTAEW